MVLLCTLGMGCQESKAATSRRGPIEDPNDPISREDELNLQKLGLINPEMVKLFNYYHRLRLGEGGMLDLELYLRSVRLLTCRLTIRIFDSRDALPDKHKHVCFMEVWIPSAWDVQCW